MNMLELYKNIKKRRNELQMTQSELAEKMGYADKSMISRIEKGEIDLQQSKILAFAKILNMHPGDLMGYDSKNLSIKDTNFALSDLEKEIICKFRLLDHGKREAILLILEINEKKAHNTKPA